ncbi:MAG TPA: AraC family transcriptional regulator [Pyrinomonadaceae bacterium]|nr:AraC family transcriptional regulator [Pyrinomonadaceae bacterium]
MSATFTIQAKAIEKIINFATQQGVQPSDLYAAVNLNAAVLQDPDNRIPFSQLVLLYETAAELTGDSNFGLHLGEIVDPKLFDVVGYSALNSATLGEAFTRVARYHSVWTDGAMFKVEVSDPTSAIFYRYVDESILSHRQDSEMTFASVAALCRVAVYEGWTPTLVEFKHSEPQDISEQLRLFRCPITFGAPVNKLVFDSSSLDLPIATADPGLCRMLDRHAEELLAKFPPRDSFISNARTIISKELNGGNASLERVAAQMGLSARTLQRKLHELGTSHNDLVDQIRHELAKRYLREREMAICEVAYLLGFSEPSSFHRAFKRWTGVTPKEFRAER